ncbi:MAG: DUF4255 domain-containing protein [Dokdonella sp.]
MSNSLAIAATTLTLRNLLQQEIPVRDGNLPSLNVTTLPPDMARKNVIEGGAQLNLFLYQTLVNAAWRNQDPPDRTRPGEVARPPLALNLHYLLTAYGDQSDDEGMSHRVLGGAMSVLHDHPLLSRSEIRGVLANNDLADQFERLRVTPLTLPMDEMSKLWTALQTNYRVSAGYEVTVVLINSQLAGPASLPVLRRGSQDRGADVRAALAPSLTELRYPRGQVAARLGDDIVLRCSALDLATTMLRFSSPRIATPLLLAALAGDAPGEVKFKLAPAVAPPPAMPTWVPGLYTLAALVGAAGEPKLVSNELAFALAPTITLTPTISVSPGDPQTRDVTLAVDSAPACREGQGVLLVFGDRQVDAIRPPPTTPPVDPDPTAVFAPEFLVKGVAPASRYVARLRVDGVDSIPVTYDGGGLPVFDLAQQVNVP